MQNPDWRPSVSLGSWMNPPEFLGTWRSCFRFRWRQRTPPSPQPPKNAQPIAHPAAWEEAARGRGGRISLLTWSISGAGKATTWAGHRRARQAASRWNWGLARTNPRSAGWRAGAGSVRGEGKGGHGNGKDFPGDSFHSAVRVARFAWAKQTTRRRLDGSVRARPGTQLTATETPASSVDLGGTDKAASRPLATHVPRGAGGAPPRDVRCPKKGAGCWEVRLGWASPGSETDHPGDRRFGRAPVVG